MRHGPRALAERGEKLRLPHKWPVDMTGTRGREGELVRRREESGGRVRKTAGENHLTLLPASSCSPVRRPACLLMCLFVVLPMCSSPASSPVRLPCLWTIFDVTTSRAQDHLVLVPIPICVGVQCVAPLDFITLGYEIN